MKGTKNCLYRRESRKYDSTVKKKDRKKKKEKLKIETFSIFIIFLKCATKEPRIDFFAEQSAINHYSTGP